MRATYSLQTNSSPFTTPSHSPLLKQIEINMQCHIEAHIAQQAQQHYIYGQIHRFLFSNQSHPNDRIQNLISHIKNEPMDINPDNTMNTPTLRAIQSLLNSKIFTPSISHSKTDIEQLNQCKAKLNTLYSILSDLSNIDQYCVPIQKESPVKIFQNPFFEHQPVPQPTSPHQSTPLRKSVKPISSKDRPTQLIQAHIKHKYTFETLCQSLSVKSIQNTPLNDYGDNVFECPISLEKISLFEKNDVYLLVNGAQQGYLIKSKYIQDLADKNPVNQSNNQFVYLINIDPNNDKHPINVSLLK